MTNCVGAWVLLSTDRKLEPPEWRTGVTRSFDFFSFTSSADQNDHQHELPKVTFRYNYRINCVWYYTEVHTHAGVAVRSC